MELRIDDKDNKIIRALREDSKLSTSKLSRKLNLPITTIHHRIKKLEQNKVIKKYTIDIDEIKLGRMVQAWILISVGKDHIEGIGKDQDMIAKEILKVEGITQVYTITGLTDILAKVRVNSIKDLNEFLIKRLRKMEGVERTQTSIVLNEFDK